MARAAATPARSAPRVERVRPGVPRMFSIRALVFGLVLIMAFVLVYPTLNSYIRQQADLAELHAQVVAARARNEDLKADVARWDDRAYVVAQARERLSFVLPGETPYRVVDPETVPDTPVAKAEGPTSVLDAESTQPWYASVLDSVAVAGSLPVDADTTTTAPTPKPTDG
ncbi:FtsB family cell division protein [Cellulomonas edaphi]|uniref:Septum formation initiator family protein n=1 Tax=Cellulomonas edaphi TaxID=3053468 RepID=A0ABT7S5B8_9CELL|nr:septum formation initiator family protein [Cellulomons edaphi]MDM7830709.1 septum formation initiator family protein [Cellulomons edaphi]